MVPLGPMPIQNFHHVGSLYIEINLGRVWKGVFRQFHLRETSSILLITLSQVSYKEGSHNRRCKLILNVNDAAAMQIARFTMVRKWVHSLPSFCQSVQELNLSHFSEQVHHHFTNIISLGPFWPLPSLSIYRTDCSPHVRLHPCVCVRAWRSGEALVSGNYQGCSQCRKYTRYKGGKLRDKSQISSHTGWRNPAYPG